MSRKSTAIPFVCWRQGLARAVRSSVTNLYDMIVFIVSPGGKPGQDSRRVGNIGWWQKRLFFF